MRGRVAATEMAETIPEQFNTFLAEPRNALMCISRGADHPPHATPVWFNYEHGRFEISITRTRAKYGHLQRHPLVTLVIDDPMGFKTVIVEGPAVVTDDDGSLVALARKLRAKHRVGQPQPPDEEILRGLQAEERVVVTVEPESVVSWAR